jgi:hypothetical protein
MSIVGDNVDVYVQDNMFQLSPVISRDPLSVLMP